MVHIIKNGGNYGWSIKEAFHPFNPRQKADTASPIPEPLVEYPHSPNLERSGRYDDGKSITGGYVYRGKALPELAGVYVYGDFDTGRIWGLREKDGKAVEQRRADRRQGPEEARTSPPSARMRRASCISSHLMGGFISL